MGQSREVLKPCEVNEMAYNGWTNYETWNVALWLDNEEGSYHYWNDRAQEIANDEGKEDGACTLADELKASIGDNAPELEGTYSDLLSAALSEVDWYEIAEHYMSDVEVEDEDAEDSDDDLPADPHTSHV